MWFVVLAGLLRAGAAVSAEAPLVHGYCFEQAAQAYGVNADVLRAIAWHESHFLPWIVHRNRDGSTDYGPMQINSRNLAFLGLDRRAVLASCTNIMAGARLYLRMVRRYGNTWAAVGAYHSTTLPLQREYAEQVAGTFARVELFRSWLRHARYYLHSWWAAAA